MTNESEWSLHLTMRGPEQPEFAWLSRDELDTGSYWVADCEFGPFDTLLDVHRWLARAIRERLAARPG